MTAKRRYNNTSRGHSSGLKRIMRCHYNNKTCREGTSQENESESTGFLRALLPIVLTSVMMVILAVVVLATIDPSILSALWHSLSAISRGNPLGEYP